MIGSPPTHPLLGQMYGHWHHDGGHPWVALVFLLLVAAAVAVAVWAVVRATSANRHPAAAPPWAADPALDALRMRFARGEIDAAEFAARSAQLGGHAPAPPAPPPPAPPAPPA